MQHVRGFKVVFTVIGVLYVLMASSMLVRGPDVLREFGVVEPIVASPVLADFFLFFYQLMAALGVLMVLIGHVTREGAAQRWVAGTFCVFNVLVMLRDLSTSDSRFGNHLYLGEKTLVFVFISLVFAIAMGVLVALPMRRLSAAPGAGVGRG
jgi:quinol-cytochrome oxidoreductase complex cytochrome b subunit